MQIKMMEEGKY